MPRKLLFLFIGILLSACTFATDPNTPYIPGFFYFSTRDASLVFQNNPKDAPRQTFPLPQPADCSLFDIRPAPRGRWIAVEWDCPSGPRVGLLESSSGRMRFALEDQTIDNRLLAWHPDGRSLYLKIGMLSYPQTLRVAVETLKATELPVPGFVYDLTVSPDGAQVLYSLSNGIGFGSETWLGAENAANASQLLLEPQSITALAQFSPDGSQIAYIKMPDSQEQYPAGELWIMNSDGSNARFAAITDAGRGFPPVWSPGGDKIAFVGRNDPADDQALNLSIYDLASASLVTEHYSLITVPVWSPDGAFLTFSARENDTIAVWLYEIGAQKAEIIAQNACCAGWIR